MKTLSALALALSFAVGSGIAMAPVADATTMTKKPAACVSTKTKPCATHKMAHKKATHKKVVNKAAAKTPAKPDASKS